MDALIFSSAQLVQLVEQQLMRGRSCDEIAKYLDALRRQAQRVRDQG